MGLCALGIWVCTCPGERILNACVIRTESLSVVSSWRGSFETALWETLALARGMASWREAGSRQEAPFSLADFSNDRFLLLFNDS